MATSFKYNKSLDLKDFIKAHMTKGEIQGMEAMQGHFTSVDSKTGLREFSHLIPIFKNKDVLNYFESLEKQLSEKKDYDDLTKSKYKTASKHLRSYSETPIEKAMTKFGRGKDKHLVLLPNEIARFFMKINKKNNSVNPKTGFLEFGRSGAPSGRSERNAGSGFSFSQGAGGNRGSAPSSRSERNAGPGFDFTSATSAGGDRGSGDNQAPGAVPPLQALSPTNKNILPSILQTGGSILGFLLGGPMGSILANMVGSGLRGHFDHRSPTRLATAAAQAALSSNPILSMAIGLGGEKLANNIPRTSQEAMNQYAAGNINSGAPNTERGDKMHYEARETPIVPTPPIVHEAPSQYIEDLYANIRPPQSPYLAPTKQALKQKTSLRPQTEETSIDSYADPITRSIQKLKQKKLIKESGKTRTSEKEEQWVPQNFPEMNLPPQNIVNNPHIPQLTTRQKQDAIDSYMVRNPPNPKNPFEVREDAGEAQKRAFQDYFKSHAREINPNIYG